MKPSDIYHALRHTPLYDEQGGHTSTITNIYDRESLALLVTRDADVIVDLLQDAVAAAYESGINFRDSMTWVIECAHRRSPFGMPVHVAAAGNGLMEPLLHLINQHIDQNAADWLALARQYEADLRDGEEMDRGHEDRREATS